MKRQDKYPNTDTFRFYNANPLGKYTGDCVARAISAVTGMSWETVIVEITNFGIPLGLPYDVPDCYSKYIEHLGMVKFSQPRVGKKRLTGKQFLKQFKGACVLHIGGLHIVCANKGVIFDTWDCTDNCVGNFWVVPKDVDLVPEQWRLL